jgi:sugar phosphate isomerase/epimerase
MEIGIFAKTFVRPTLSDTLDAVAAQGLGYVQFNLSCAGIATMPDELDPALATSIASEMSARRLEMSAVSGTFNMIDPDLARRSDGLRRLGVLAASCRDLRTSVITLCTGSRDPENMWRRHADNDSPEAWRDLVVSLSKALEFAERHDVTLAFEPEVSNVVDSAVKGRRLLDEIASPRLKVIMDAANLFHSGELPRMREIIAEAFDLLGGEVVLAHAKDLSRDGEAGHETAGHGVLDYNTYLAHLRSAGYDGALVLHGLPEEHVAEAVVFLRRKLAAP